MITRLIPFYTQTIEYTQTQEDTLASTLIGHPAGEEIIYNTTLNIIRFWNGTAFESSPSVPPDIIPLASATSGGGIPMTGTPSGKFLKDDLTWVVNEGGSQGNQGNQGYQGLTGIGTQGFQGNQGYQGFQGNDGTNGAQGNQGNQGYQGNVGADSTVQGPQGNQGYQGLTGSGTQGNQGNQGNQGYQGLTGSGTQGSQGNQGNQGAIGSGTQGFQGNQGNQGNAGSIGNQGNQGNQGAVGGIGNQGNRGNQGFQGSVGAGTQGTQGAQGDQGYQELIGYVVGNQTTTGQALVNITGLSVPLAANGKYIFSAVLHMGTTAVTTGIQFGIQTSVDAATVRYAQMGAQTAILMVNNEYAARNTAGKPLLLTSGMQGPVYLDGYIANTANAQNLTIRHLKVTSGTSTVYAGSYLAVWKVG